MDERVEPEVQVDFSLSLGTGRLDVSLNVPAAQISMTQMLPVLQTLSSTIVGAIVQNVEQEGYQISCKAGCGACCRQVVPINLFEAQFLAEWIRSLPIESQVSLENRFSEALKKLSLNGVLEAVGRWNSDENVQAEKTAFDYLKADVPCPFLVDESCSIHPIRPLICREYLVTSPAELCTDPSANPVVGVPMPVKLSGPLVRIAAQVEKTSRGWLPLVFLFAWMKSNSRPGDVIVGPGPEMLHEIVKRLER